MQFWRSASDVADGAAESDVPWSDLLREEDRDELFEEAVELVRKNGKASTSFLQRRLRIGYPRAARLMDQLEREGIIEEAEDGGIRYRQVVESAGEAGRVELDNGLSLEVGKLDL